MAMAARVIASIGQGWPRGGQSASQSAGAQGARVMKRRIATKLAQPFQ
jgi:hypothetical protein